MDNVALEPDVAINKLGDFNSYLRIAHITRKHAGNYTCTAQNAAAYAQLTASVLVNGKLPQLSLIRPSGLLFLLAVPPRVAPFFFRSNSEAGIRIQVSCSVEEGDLPVTITWLKDGVPVSPQSNGIDSMVSGGGQRVPVNVDVRQYDEYSSLLVIPHLSQEHSGNYTCQIGNAARVASHTAPLTVSGSYQMSTQPTYLRTAPFAS